MWFILLFALFGLAIPIAFEIYEKGADNILTRSGEQIRTSRLGDWIRAAIEGLFGAVQGWVYSAITVAGTILLVGVALKSVVWIAKQVLNI